MTDPDEFRRVMGQFATGVTVVTFPPASEPHGITVNAFASASLDPPLVLICLDNGTESHAMLDAGEVDAFCVNVLSASQRELGEHFAGMEELSAPFEGTEPAASGAPAFQESIAYLDCSLDSATRVGDHTVYVGRVEEAVVRDATTEALTFFRGGWNSVGTRAPDA